MGPRGLPSPRLTARPAASGTRRRGVCVSPTALLWPLTHPHAVAGGRDQILRSAPRKRARPHVAHTVSNSDARARPPPKNKNRPCDACARARAPTANFVAGGHRTQTGASAAGATPRNQIPNCIHSGRTRTLSQLTLFLTRAAAKIAPIRARAGARARGDPAPSLTPRPPAGFRSGSGRIRAAASGTGRSNLPGHSSGSTRTPWLVGTPTDNVQYCLHVHLFGSKQGNVQAATPTTNSPTNRLCVCLGGGTARRRRGRRCAGRGGGEAGREHGAGCREGRGPEEGAG